MDPFPRPIGVGITQFKKGNVDSFTSKRWNLSNSSHFYTFATNGGNATITLNIEGLGPAANPSANDLDLFLYDGNGRRLELSRNLNGQPELITGIRHLLPGSSQLLRARGDRHDGVQLRRIPPHRPGPVVNGAHSIIINH